MTCFNPILYIQKQFLQYILEGKYVKSYFDHLTSLENLKEIRKYGTDSVKPIEEKGSKKQSSKSLVQDGKAASLRVPELDKYGSIISSPIRMVGSTTGQPTNIMVMDVTTIIPMFRTCFHNNVTSSF